MRGLEGQGRGGKRAPDEPRLVWQPLQVLDQS